MLYKKMFLKILFFVFLFFSNFFLYLAITFHIIFGFVLLNFSVICLILFFYSFNKKDERNLTDQVLDSAENHPIIKSARERLKKN